MTGHRSDMFDHTEKRQLIESLVCKEWEVGAVVYLTEEDWLKNIHQLFIDMFFMRRTALFTSRTGKAVREAVYANEGGTTLIVFEIEFYDFAAVLLGPDCSEKIGLYRDSV